MANVFQVPGVPPLGSYLAGGLSLLTGDSFVSTLGQAVLQWGIFLTGATPNLPAPFSFAAGALTPAIPIILPANPLTPVLQPLSLVNALIGSNIFPVTASFVDVEYKQDWPVSDYPIEQGAFQSYDKVQLPFTIRVRLAVSGNAAILEAFLDVIQTMANDVSGLYQVVTPSKIYSSCTVTHYDYRRTATSGVSLLVVDVWFIQIRQTATTSLFDNTANAAFAGQQNTGIVQPQTPAPSFVQRFDAQGGAN